VRERNVRTALKGIDTALKALEMFAKLSGQLQGPQHMPPSARVPSRPGVGAHPIWECDLAEIPRCF
jgi:hypothetical protein